MLRSTPLLKNRPKPVGWIPCCEACGWEGLIRAAMSDGESQEEARAALADHRWQVHGIRELQR